MTVEPPVDGDPRLRKARRAIFVSVGVIWAGCLAVPVVALLDETDTARQWLGVVGVLILTLAYAAMLYAVATPSVSERQRRRLGWGFAAASVLSIVITIAGVVALWGLPISQYPEITPPTVQVTCVYPGANAQTAATMASTCEARA